MHRAILGLRHGDGVEGDHRNGDRLDNTRSNLRIVTDAQQAQNQRARGRSGYRGVAWHAPTGRWQASVRVAGRQRCLGYFARPEEAAAVAEVARTEHMPYSVRR